MTAARSAGAGAHTIRPPQPTLRRMLAARAARTIHRTVRSPEATTARERAEATQNDKGLTPELSRRRSGSMVFAAQLDGGRLERTVRARSYGEARADAS